MGYYVDLVEADFVIPEREDVLEALRAMPKKYKAIQRGGSSNGEKWFSWMSDKEIESAESAQSVFEMLGFECEKDKYGVPNTFSLESYNSKTGQEDLFLAVVAQFMPEDSYTEWRGEDGQLWRYVVRDKKLMVQSSRVEWNYPETFRVAVFHSTGSFAEKTYKTRTIHVDPYGDVDAQIQDKLEKTNA